LSNLTEVTLRGVCRQSAKDLIFYADAAPYQKTKALAKKLTGALWFGFAIANYHWRLIILGMSN